MEGEGEEEKEEGERGGEGEGEGERRKWKEKEKGKAEEKWQGMLQHLSFNSFFFRYRELLQEAGDVETKRHVARTELEALKKAKKVIQMSEIVDLPN